MSRAIKQDERERLNVWVLRNQIKDMAQIKQVTGKTKTAIISEALDRYFTAMRQEGVL